MMQDHNGAKCESKVRKGPWSEEEDDLLRKCIEKYGEDSCWKRVPQRAGLNRCRKSCRWRWLNYLRPGIKRGDFSEDEADIIASQHKLLGNRWSLIAAKLPGRTINDVKNYCSTQLYKDYISSHEVTLTSTEDNNGLGIGPGNGFGPEENEQNNNDNWLENLLGSDEYSSHNYSGPSIGPFLEDEEFDNNENMDYWISSLRDEPNLPFVMNNWEG